MMLSRSEMALRIWERTFNPSFDARELAAVAVRGADALIAKLDEGQPTAEQHTFIINGVEYRTTSEKLVAEIARLRAELAKYTEPLTNDQMSAAMKEMRVGNSANARKWDAAIRKVRSGEGE